MTTATLAEPRWFLANLARVLVRTDDLGIVEVTGSRGDMPPLHLHDEDETFVVLEGELSLHVPGRSLTLREGEGFAAPRDVPHVYRVESETARWLAVSTPGRFTDFVIAASEPAGYDGLPPAREIDADAVAATAAENGIEIVGPPGTMP